MINKSFTVGLKPKQNIPESQKTEQWVMENIDWCIAMSPINFTNKHKYQYDMYNGKRDASKFKHLTETFGVEFPAGKIKHIPLIRPLLNRLHGEQEERPFNFMVRAEDTDALDAKKNEIGLGILGDIVEAVRNGEDVDVALDSIEKYYTTEFQTNLEKGTHYALKSYYQKYHLDRKFSANFLDKIITGKEYYRVVINRIGEDPEYIDISPGDLFYADNNVQWVKECDWAVMPEELTPIEILDKYGQYMTEEERGMIEDWTDMYHKDSFHKLNSFEDADRLLDDPRDVGDTTAAVNHKVTVYHVEFKSIREVTYVENENKYVPDAPFIKIISEEKLQELPRSRRKKLKKRYIQDRWSGIRIGDEIYIKMGKDKYVTRSAGNPSKCYLTFNGPTYNGNKKPFSFMDATEDLQDLYDILHFHKENLVALSGTKGSYMDLAQMPDFKTGSFEGNLKMFLYYKKMGTAFINSAREGNPGRYNQFGTYDDTLGQGLGVIIEMIKHIEELAGRIVGVNRQQLGAISQRDGKATTENALIQSSLTTEPIFNEHDEFVKQALEDILNACKIAWKDGYTSSYISDEFVQRIFTMEPLSPLSDMEVYLTNRISEQRTIEEMKANAFGMMREGLLEFDDIIPLFRKSSLPDILQTIEKNLSKRREEIRQQQAQVQQLEQQLATAKAQGEIEKIRADIAKIQSEIELNERKAALEERELAVDTNLEEQKIALDSKRVDLEAKQLEYSGKAKEVKDK